MTVPVRDPDQQTELTAPYWEGFADGEVRLPRCRDCEEFHWHPKRRCPHCRSDAITWEATSGRGTVFTWVGLTYDFKLPFLADEVPLYTGLVEPAETDSIRLAAVIDPGDRPEPDIGMAVAATFPADEDADWPAPVYVPQ